MAGKFPLHSFMLWGPRQTLVPWCLWWLLQIHHREYSSMHPWPWQMNHRSLAAHPQGLAGQSPGSPTCQPFITRGQLLATKTISRTWPEQTADALEPAAVLPCLPASAPGQPSLVPLHSPESCARH